MFDPRLIHEYRIRKARTQMESFVTETMPDFVWGWFPRILCRVLEDFYDELIMGYHPRYMLFAPPRSGKTEIASRRFPAWVLGQDNTLPIIATSYGADLASRTSKDVQRIIDTDIYQRIFPDTRLPTRKTAGTCLGSLWDVLSHQERLTGGSYRSAGVCGAITGQGFKLGIIDDPVKDYRDASSKNMQELTRRWYDTTFFTRRNPLVNGILIIQTRWHKKDLSGQLQDEMLKGGQKWKVFNFPMELEDEQEVIEVGGKRYCTRKKGDILFTERMPPEFVEECKGSPLTWGALYQGRPTLDGGEFFRAAWWSFYDELPEPFERIIITSDTAQKTGEVHDYTVFQVWGLKEHKIYLIDQVRGKWDADDLLKTAKALWDEWKGGTVGPRVRANAFYVEDKASGTGLIQSLARSGVPVLGIGRTKDKATRAIDKQSRFAAGQIVLPRYKPWLTEFLMEYEDFTLMMTHPHDDQIDPTLDAIDILLDNGGPLNYIGMVA